MASCLDRPLHTGEPRGIQGARADAAESQPTVLGHDVLLVVDDSISMGDKQRVLRDSLLRLEMTPAHCTPPANDRDTDPRISYPPVDGKCPDGWGYGPVLSMRNQAVITTSMEAGGLGCIDSSRGGHPLPPLSIQEGNVYNESLSELDRVGENGCGYESPLEAMYRFLVDPEPPLRVTTREEEGKIITVAEGIDEELLRKRADFLHPLSRVLVLILTDEDDCSVKDSGDAWKVGEAPGLARGSAACELSPNDPCCRSCDIDEDEPPLGCAPLVDDEVCKASPAWAAKDDPPNLRCFEQKRRFGKDWLFPIERYTEALRSPKLLTRSGEEVSNPLFAHGRTPDMVNVMVISGTPWQLLTTPESKAKENVMEFLTPAQLVENDVWSTILGEPSLGIAPKDAHMRASIDPRQGLPNASGSWDPIHGHEVDWPKRNDLQYSCIFDLPEPRSCQNKEPCLCSQGQAEKLPVCRNDQGGYDGMQRRAHAYPSPRLLEFIREMGPQGYLGSVCPRHLREPDDGWYADVGYGYSDAVLMMSREAWSGFFPNTCFTRPLPLEKAGKLRCHYLEMHEGEIDCATVDRVTPPASFATAMKKTRNRDERTGPVTVCELPMMKGDPNDPASDAYQCLNELHPEVKGAGYCYIDPERGFGSARLVGMCVTGHERRVRVIPEKTGRPGVPSGLYCDYG